MTVAVVGVCASGKTTLVKGLQARGFAAYNVAQEHSCIKKFWQKKNPQYLVMIDASLPAIKKRRLVFWDEARLEAQHERLKDAKEHADLYIYTDDLSAEDVLNKVTAFLEMQEAKRNQKS